MRFKIDPFIHVFLLVMVTSFPFNVPREIIVHSFSTIFPYHYAYRMSGIRHLWSFRYRCLITLFTLQRIVRFTCLSKTVYYSCPFLLKKFYTVTLTTEIILPLNVNIKCNVFLILYFYTCTPLQISFVIFVFLSSSSMCSSFRSLIWGLFIILMLLFLCYLLSVYYLTLFVYVSVYMWLLTIGVKYFVVKNL